MQLFAEKLVLQLKFCSPTMPITSKQFGVSQGVNPRNVILSHVLYNKIHDSF